MNHLYFGNCLNIFLAGRQPQLPFNTDNTTFKKAQKNEAKSVSKGLFD
jgi:hypothetical protein